MNASLAVRWTIGDISPRGFEALRLSIWGAWKIFGPAADYAVGFNSIALDEAIERTGNVPGAVRWRDVTGELPGFLKPYLNHSMADGAGWKFAPLRLFPERFELMLDNDCILWEMPTAVRQWVEGGHEHRCVLAEDVVACFGQFAHLCGPEPRNSGLRGLPPGFDLERALRFVLQENPAHLRTELDEQGLHNVALSLANPPLIVPLREVTICSPFPPHQPTLGRCGAHFVGLNAKELPWDFVGRPATDYLRGHWEHLRPEIQQRVFLPAGKI